jgi:hypothetical protein
MSNISNKQDIPVRIGSKHRLAEISHHFLSNEDERSPAWQDTTIIPVLLGSKHDDYIVYELNRAFNRHDGNQKNSSMVLNIEGRLTTSSTPSPFMESLVTETSSNNDPEKCSMPDYCLVPVTSSPTTMALQSDRFIIAVHASLPGVRIAYDQLAFMASLETDFKVCVIMLDAKNMRDAKRFFGFLCDNAQSLLALELECGGFLLQDDDNTSPINYTVKTESTDEDIATDLDSVANEILRKFTSGINHMTASQLSAPAGVAGLLS